MAQNDKVSSGTKLKAPSLMEAARAAGIAVKREMHPQDKFVTVGKLKVHYLDWGTEGKPYMLLQHSNSQTCHAWDFFALTMSPDYHVLSTDLRGHGDTDWDPEGNYNLASYLKDTEGFVEALGLLPSIFIGNAMGGMIYMAYAAEHPDRVRAMVMADSAIQPEPDANTGIRNFIQGPDELDSIDAFVERAYQYNPRRSRESYLGSLQHSLKQLPNGKWTWKYDKLFRDPDRPRRPPSHTTEQMWELASRVKCPALIVRGALSKTMGDATMARLSQVMPQARLVTMEGAGHLLVGDKPVEFERLVREFLSTI